MSQNPFQSLTWLEEKRALLLLDQRRLPSEELFFECRNLRQVTEAIKTLAVRGAPAIGVAAAYGVVIGVQAAEGLSGRARQNPFSDPLLQPFSFSPEPRTD